MHRRYTIHKDGDLLVEDLDEAGNPLSPEDVQPGDLLPISVVVRAADDADAHGALLELLELAYNIETEGPPEPKDGGKDAPLAAPGGKKLPVVE